MHDVHTDGSGFRRKSHVAHEQGDEKAMQREIDDLKNNSVGQNRSSTLPALMSRPMMKKILYIDNGLELYQANISPVRMSIFTKGNVEALLIKE